MSVGVLPVHRIMAVSSHICISCWPWEVIAVSMDWRCAGMESPKVVTQESGRSPTLALKSPAKMICPDAVVAVAALRCLVRVSNLSCAELRVS